MGSSHGDISRRACQGRVCRVQSTLQSQAFQALHTLAWLASASCSQQVIHPLLRALAVCPKTALVGDFSHITSRETEAQTGKADLLESDRKLAALLCLWGPEPLLWGGKGSGGGLASYLSSLKLGTNRRGSWGRAAGPVTGHPLVPRPKTGCGEAWSWAAEGSDWVGGGPSLCALLVQKGPVSHFPLSTERPVGNGLSGDWTLYSNASSNRDFPTF